MSKIIGASIPNIPWQDKPEGYKYPVWRYDGNPVITRDNLYGANSIFNSAVVPDGEGFEICEQKNIQKYFFFATRV